MMLARRAALAGCALLLPGAPSEALPVARSPDWPALAARWLTPLRNAVTATGAPGLIRSYTVREGADATEFDRVHANCAYVYDNAVAGLVLLAAGDRPAAVCIADALAMAQAGDRFWRDGRLRNAYAAGPMQQQAALPGWWDASRATWLEDGTAAGTSTGVLAWAMLLWTALGEQFRQPAERAAEWIAATQSSDAGFTGGFLGHEPAPTRLSWISTEHNFDCAVVFARLGRAAEAGRARGFVDAMWDPGETRSLSGLTPDGQRNRHSAVDANLWPMLAGFGHPAALDWVLSRHGLPEGAPADRVDGVDFDTDRDGIWMEGTAIAALACRQAGRDAGRLGATLAANTGPDGMVQAANVERLTTGLSTGLDDTAPPFFYFRRPHVAATAWAALAALGRSPFEL